MSYAGHAAVMWTTYYVNAWCDMQACGQAGSSSAAAELLQVCGWWRPHEQVCLIRAARTEAFPAAAQVSFPLPNTFSKHRTSAAHKAVALCWHLLQAAPGCGLTELQVLAL